ncbi:unnamed protein product (macronuclear) [Paramecium tetraurelia]|uniref:Uncharacterized protein n=1 Tax=Paramecium tetraurelia TaxID=5888 RepID=A0BDA9_PARTE|nr:uncharacterized protein GSPATT00004620001 [Paramecium tetraurelia]CAK56526.1 unnamed protein product [Paramecium tetraurelia]|eukprot:XP_001423924.1 hypothetical protein (macronuclear) [Paramecium tetraurelia strain d4-2]
MFEGTRLQYIVPGYTGHIPKGFFEQQVGYYQEEKPQNHIPGYAGEIKSMKAENLFAQTYGKITYSIQHDDYYKGQDVPPESRYKSQLKDTYQNQNKVQLRTAAEIVGVKPKPIEYKIPQTETAKTFFKVDQQGNPQLRESLENWKSEYEQHSETIDQATHKFYGDPGQKVPIPLGTPLPGYTGMQKRVVAANIFGQTFANARKTALQDDAKIKDEKMNTFKQQASFIPALKR